jgi:hypothetical protein
MTSFLTFYRTSTTTRSFACISPTGPTLKALLQLQCKFCGNFIFHQLAPLKNSEKIGFDSILNMIFQQISYLGDINEVCVF